MKGRSGLRPLARAKYCALRAHRSGSEVLPGRQRAGDRLTLVSYLPSEQKR